MIGRPAPAVAVLLHDGFYGCGTGAGHSNRAFLTSLIPLLHPAVRLAVLPVWLTPGSSDYDPVWHQQSLGILAGRGQVLPVDNGTGGKSRFAGLESFRAASQSAAAAMSELGSGGSPLLIAAFDVPFYGLALLMNPSACRAVVNVARATAALQDPGNAERIAWERSGLHATVASGGHVAATSGYIREHLTAAYQIPQQSVTDLTNGLTRTEHQPGRRAWQSSLPAAAQAGFLLCLGRAEPYKGFDDLLDALQILRAASFRVPHTILAAVTDGPPLSRYQRHLAARIAADRPSVTLRTTFSHATRGLLADPRLAGVVVPSRAEPFGRIPLEAWAVGASPVIATTAGGLAETVTEPLTGYTAAPADPGSLAAAIRRALADDPARHARMLARGRALLADRYDYDATIAAFLARHAPWALGRSQSA